MQDSTEESPKIRFRRRSLKGRAKLCPNCLSPMHIADSISGWLVPATYQCEKCGYRGHVALEESQTSSE
ncbi:MAG: hypothetical protein ACYCQJ_05290 [Nitrososphaerales archaeon]